MSPCHPTWPNSPSGALLHLLGLFQEFQGGRGGCWSLSVPHPISTSQHPHSQGSGASGGASPHPRIFSPGSNLQVIPRGVNPEYPLGSFWVLTLLPNFFPSFLPPCLMDTPGKGPSPPIPFAQGCSPANSMGFSFQHIPVSSPAHSWESPLLRFLFHPGTLKQEPGNASQQTQGTSLPTFCQVGVFPWLQGFFPAPSPDWKLGLLGCSLEHPGLHEEEDHSWGAGKPFLGCC